MSESEGIQQLTDHYLDLFAYAFKFLQNRVDAEDVVHDALAETLSRNWLRNPYGYCMRIIRNKSITLLKQKGSMNPIVDDLMAEVTESEKDTRNILELMKEELSERECRLVEMHDISEMTMREISQLTGLSLSNVKKLISQAHKRLKRRLI